MADQTREEFYEEWIKSMETIQQECAECCEELTMGVSDYIQSESSYGFAFDAIFYSAKCPVCGHITEWGQREVDDSDALLLRSRWHLLIFALDMKRAIAAQHNAYEFN